MGMHSSRSLVQTVIQILVLSTISTLVLTIPSSAQLPPWRAYEFFDLTGGLNDTRDPTSIAQNEASDLQNIVFSTSGGIEKRSGFSNINSTQVELRKG